MNTFYTKLPFLFLLCLTSFILVPCQDETEGLPIYVVDKTHIYTIEEEEYTFGTEDFYVSIDGELVDFGWVNYTLCDPNQRPTECYDLDAPVCAYITGCNDTICTKTVPNDCLACIDPNIGWYISGSCEQVAVQCDPDNRPDGAGCGIDYDVVCAVASDCSGDYCLVTNYNACQACAATYVDYYLPGQCPNNTVSTIPTDEEEESTTGAIYCDPDNRPTLCQVEYNPVCIHKKGCKGSKCTSTAGNMCIACYNTTVDYFIPGVCNNQVLPESPANPEESQKTYCDPMNRPTDCGLEFQPTCTYAIDCDFEGCSGTTLNPCVACSILNADYFVSGTCPITS